ncbi:MAG TPA: S41 family peptidase [Dehalococcoidia bacterium]|nr:S41 family peptidase [Dehalococcoidia bacterium]
MRRWLPVALLAFAAVAGACATSAVPPPTPTPTIAPTIAPTPTPSPPPGTPTPDPALLEHGGVALIEKAFRLIVDGYVRPVDPAPLLEAAWSGATETAAAAGASIPAAPALPADAEGAWQAFRNAYVALVDGNPGLDTAEVRFAAIDRMASSLQDCHTYFLRPVLAQVQEETRHGSRGVGVGVEVLAAMPNVITEVYQNSPAERAGVRPGDRVLSVDGVDLSTATRDAVVGALRGPEGSEVTLVVRRPATAETLTFRLRRALVVPANVERRLLEGGVGYVRIRAFVAGGVHEDVRAALEALDRAGAKAWILDLRDNYGGELDVGLPSLFIPSGPVVRVTYREGGETWNADGSVLPFRKPMVLLVNGLTGSVSEAMAAALDEYDAAYLIGEPTFGCAGFTVETPLGDGTTLAVTSGVIVGPVSGNSLAGGVRPDEYVARTFDDLAAGRDPQLDRAIAYLRSIAGP